LDEDLIVSEATLPWTGARWYCRGAFDYMVTRGLLESCELYVDLGLRASRHIAPSTLKAHLDVIEATWDEAIPVENEEWAGVLMAQQKHTTLSLIGIMNATRSTQWSVTRSTYQDDAVHSLGHIDRIRSVPGTEGCAFDFYAETTMVSNTSLRPIGQIALDMEHVRVAMAYVLVESFRHSARVLAVVVDGLFILPPATKEFPDAFEEDLLDTLPRFADGAPMFKLKREPSYKVPTWDNRQPCGATIRSPRPPGSPTCGPMCARRS
jgi:hypothetical protein